MNEARALATMVAMKSQPAKEAKKSKKTKEAKNSEQTQEVTISEPATEAKKIDVAGAGNGNITTPDSTLRGMQSRLNNLNFECASVSFLRLVMLILG